MNLQKFSAHLAKIIDRGMMNLARCPNNVGLMHDQFTKHVSMLPLELESMISLLEKWVSINSGSDHLQGLEYMFQELASSFSLFGTKVEKLAVTPRLKVNALGELYEQPTGMRFKDRAKT